MAMVTSFAGSRFHPEAIRLLAADPAALGHTARALADIGRAAHYEGFVLDFEGMSRDDLVALRTVTRAIRDSAHAHGMRNVWLAVPAMDTASYPSAALLQVADRLIVMLYDQHWSGSSAGPIADPDWARAALAARVAEVGPSRLVAALPLYGYRWRANTDGAVVSYPEAVRFAAEAGTALSRDPVSGTLNARKPNDSTEVWVSDANQLARLIAQVRSVGVSRIAVWRLGLEDPGVWGVVRR
jgi:spore germination protein YaaH